MKEPTSLFAQSGLGGRMHLYVQDQGTQAVQTPYHGVQLEQCSECWQRGELTCKFNMFSCLSSPKPTVVGIDLIAMQKKF